MQRQSVVVLGQQSIQLAPIQAAILEEKSMPLPLLKSSMETILIEASSRSSS